MDVPKDSDRNQGVYPVGDAISSRESHPAPEVVHEAQARSIIIAHAPGQRKGSALESQVEDEQQRRDPEPRERDEDDVSERATGVDPEEDDRNARLDQRCCENASYLAQEVELDGKSAED